MADKKSILTLNLGSQRVGLARFSAAKGGGLILHDYGFAELLGDPAADSARIPQVRVAVVELVQKLGVAKENVRFAISGHSVFTRFVKLPALDEEKVDDIVRFEAQQNVPFPINEVAWDYQLVSGNGTGGEVEVALVAIKSDSLDEINEAVEDGPLLTKAVDVAPMSLYNAFRYNYADAEGCSLLIDVGARTTNLLYIEGNRVFTRSIPVGGAAATSSIAKEFDMPFADAEERKKQDGFVALGGHYADHDDPGIAAMSKVIRNTMTRLHSEIVRTTSAYRQQGGAAPAISYLCGGSASLPYLREFLNEKLNIEIEYFNALRNVAVGPKIDTDAAAGEAHVLGELVGLALREVSACPMEIDLVPGSVERRRDIDRRKPFLMVAAGCILALLLGAGMHFHRGKKLVDGELAEVNSKLQQLGGIDRKINAQLKAETEVGGRAAPLQAAVEGRTRFVEILGHLNSKLDSDKLWFTQMEGLEGGNPQKSVESLIGVDIASSFPGDPKPTKIPEPGVLTHIRLYGMYRGSADALYAFEDLIKKDPKYFKLPEEINDTRVLLQPDGDAFAGLVRYDLELAEPIRVGGAKK